ncbi:MAG: fused MFS/spermidine synthase [Vicinamibacterales bacterium]
MTVLAALTAASGAAALAYQVLWMRELSLVFGVTAYAASTVLAAFMAGLAAGSLLARRVARLGPPLAVFGAIEILIGVSALLTPVAFDAASSWYSPLARATAGAPALLTLVRFACSFAVLAVPSTLMGLTLPVLAASVPGGRFGADAGALYSANTAGAVAGALATGGVLLGTAGTWRTFQLAAMVNAVTGTAAILAARGGRGRPPAAAVTATPGSRRDGSALPWGLAAVSGAATLALEVVWLRVLTEFVIASAYAFTAVLVAVLAGLTLGAWLAARWLARGRPALPALGAALAGAGMAAPLALAAFAAAFRSTWPLDGLAHAALIAVLPPATCLGACLPLAIGAVAGASRPPAPAAVVGGLFAVNLAGGLAGALGAGFGLVPWLGGAGALAALSLLLVAAGGVAAAAGGARRLAGVAVVAGLASIAVPLAAPDAVARALARRYDPRFHEIFREAGPQATVTVEEAAGERTLYVNGLHQASTDAGMLRLHRVIGHLPMVLAPAPRDVLVVGLGGGATAGAVSRHPGARVLVVELSPAVVHAAALFAAVNDDVLAQPNVTVRVDDGRSVLGLGGRRFDVITADLVEPKYAGAGYLYSREYFALMRGALADGGVVLQWVGAREEPEYRLMLRTFLDVFPDATSWLDGRLLVGATRPLRRPPDRVATLRADPGLRRALDAIGLTDDDVLAGWFTAGPEALRRRAGTGPLLTDDRPMLEYHLGLRWLLPPVGE